VQSRTVLILSAEIKRRWKEYWEQIFQDTENNICSRQQATNEL